MRDLLIVAAIGGFLLYQRDKEMFGRVIPLQANPAPVGTTQPINPLPLTNVTQLGAAITSGANKALDTIMPVSTATPGQASVAPATNVAAVANASLTGIM